MKAVVHAVATVCAMAACVSCSTKTINMTRLVPGIISIPPGAMLRADNAYFGKGNASDIRLASEFVSVWGSKRSLRQEHGVKSVFSVSFSQTNCKEEYVQDREFKRNYTRYYISTYASFSVKGYCGMKYFATFCSSPRDPYRTLARDIVSDVLPGWTSYSVHVKTDKRKTPLMYKAVVACQENEWEQGLDLAMESLKTVPDDSETWYLLGVIHRHFKNYGKSNECFRKAYDIEPKDKYTYGVHNNNVIEADEVAANCQRNT